MNIRMVTVWVDCQVCGGVGRIKHSDGVWFPCSACEGTSVEMKTVKIETFLKTLKPLLAGAIIALPK